MKRLVYLEIIKDIESFEFDLDVCLKKLCEKYPEEKPKTLRSIVSQQYQRRVKKAFPLMNNPQKRKKLFAEYEKRVEQGDRPGIIIDIAKKNRYSPQLMSKIIVEEFMSKRCPEAGNKRATHLVKHTAEIEDRDLAFEVWECGIKDDNYGSSADAIKHGLGEEYEQRIKQRLQQLGIGFQDEKYFRNKGYDKTPDIKLEIPISINGTPVNWIESKALFGDDESHKTYLRDQLWSYWNRFGAGLVIYWFGYIDDLKNSRNHSGILLSDSFPEDIVEFDPSFGIEKLLLSGEESGDEEEAL